MDEISMEHRMTRVEKLSTLIAVAKAGIRAELPDKRETA